MDYIPLNTDLSKNNYYIINRLIVKKQVETKGNNKEKANDNINIVNKDNLFSKFAQKDTVPKEKQVGFI